MHSAIGAVTFDLLEGQRLLLGRKLGGADIEMEWDPRISRRHGHLSLEGGQTWFEDLGSTNGSWIGSERLNGKVPFNLGASVLIGETVMDITEEGNSDVATIEEDLEKDDLAQLREAVAKPYRTGGTASVQADFGVTLPPGVRTNHTMTLDVREYRESLPPEPEVREHPRFITKENVEVRLPDRSSFSELWTQDLSKGGLFVETSEPPGIDATITVRIATPDGDLVLSARVVHVLDETMAASCNMKAGVGLQFTDLDSERRERIERYVTNVAERLEFAGSASDETDTDAQVLLDLVRQLLTSFEKNALYDALMIDPWADDDTVRQALITMREAFEMTSNGLTPPQKARIASAHNVVDRIARVLTEPRKRLEYDFRQGRIEAAKRISSAREGTGPALADLRAAWVRVAPERVDQAALLTRQAFEAAHNKNFAKAIQDGRRALEHNPFFIELADNVKRWESGSA